jgi:hypothetical protein
LDKNSGYGENKREEFLTTKGEIEPSVRVEEGRKKWRFMYPLCAFVRLRG